MSKTLASKMFASLAIVLAVGSCRNQPAITPQNPTILTIKDFEERYPQEKTSRFQAFVSKGDLQCSPIPTQDEVNTANAFYQDYYMSAKRAASLGIPIVNASGQTDFLVIVRDYQRFKPCQATDNKTTIYYGQVIRAVIELTDYQADVKLSLSFLAASATLKGQQQYFYLYKSGWYSPKSDGILASVSGKVFDVENYALYQGIMPQLIGLLSEPTTSLAPMPFNRIPPSDDPNFIMASARAYGFFQAKGGTSCADAVKKFAQDPARAAAVIDAYGFLGKPNCTNEPIIEPEKSKAVSALGGLSVK
jgi:hypothetical protein